MVKKIEELIGRHVKTVITKGHPLIYEVIFETDGGKFRMYHNQECCEQVALVDVDGWDAFEDAIIYDAEVVTKENTHFDPLIYMMWTFYKFRTSKGYCTLRWIGESNGYYSVEVTVEAIEDEER